MKRIFWFIQQLARMGGSEMVSIQIANELAKDSAYEVNIVTSSGKEEIRAFTIDPRIKVTHLGLPYHFYAYDHYLKESETSKKYHRIVKAIFHNQFIMYISKFFYRNKIRKFTTKDDILIFSSWDNYIVAPRGRTVYYHFHFNARFYNLWYVKLGRLFMRKPDKYIFLTSTTMEAIKYRRVINNGYVINNPVRFDCYLNTEPKGHRILFLGRYTQQKDPLLAIMVACELKKYTKDFQLIMYGGGIMKQEMIALCNKLDVNDVVSINESTNNTLELIRSCDIHLLTSEFEGWPLVVIETKAQSIPSVMSYWGDGTYESLIDGETGYIIPSNDPKEYAKKLFELLSNPRLLATMKENSYRYARRFSLDKIIEEWKKIL